MEKQDLIAEQMNEAMDQDDEDELDEEAEKIIQDIEFKAGGGGQVQTKQQMNQTKNTEDFENDLADLK